MQSLMCLRVKNPLEPWKDRQQVYLEVVQEKPLGCGVHEYGLTIDTDRVEDLIRCAIANGPDCASMYVLCNEPARSSDSGRSELRGQNVNTSAWSYLYSLYIP